MLKWVRSRLVTKYRGLSSRGLGVAMRRQSNGPSLLWKRTSRSTALRRVILWATSFRGWPRQHLIS